MKRLIIILTVCCLIAGCGQTAQNESTEIVTSPTVATGIELPDVDDSLVTIQTGTTSESGDAIITLSDSGIEINGSGASAEGSVLTVTASGTYILSGTLSDGQIRVDTDSSETVKLILSGIDVTCSDGPAIYILNAQKKVVLELATDSVNKVEDGETYSDTSTDAPSAAIYSKEDLDIQGSGTLYVTGNYNKGIQTNDDLSIEGGTLIVTAVDDGIRGKDSIEISGGNITIYAGADGLRTNNETDVDKGYIEITSGEIYIEAGQDGIQAVTDCSIFGGTIAIECGGGSENSSQTSESWGSWGGGGRGGFGGGGQQSSSSSSSSSDGTSAKGIKAAGELSISGGTFSIDSSDDALHSNGNLTIISGEIYISSGDDGIHADDTLLISGGVITVEQSYEGLEALNVTINGGEISVVASDDGINAAGGNDGSSMNGRPGQNSFASSSSGLVTIAGGVVLIDASGDGIDSNGNIVQTGGSATVFGPTNSANGPLDFAGSFELSSGTFIAVGAVGMAQTISDCAQGQIAVTLNANENSTVTVTASNGTEVLSFTTPKRIECLVCSAPTLVSGQTYTISVDGSALGDIQAQ
ncbi:MAG: carbohydrate-binding domain-containing protein [Clostridia bacterium]|nr:carbohydrate-binding domain-containing protein [Clostridia bacterium]